MKYPQSTLKQLECSQCGQIFDADVVQTLCLDCASPLLARYDLEAARTTLTREALAARPKGIWRWSEILPVRSVAHRLTLGEGDTPMLKAGPLGQKLGMQKLYVKDEASNPAGTVHARRMAVALSRALELGGREFCVRAEDGAGEALAVYAARAGVWARVFLRAESRLACQALVKLSGAELALGEEPSADNSWFDVSALREPYGCEGQKTLGLELAESFGWELPEVIFYPASDETGLVGMWKAFSELEQLGLIGTKRPRMVSVQAEGRSDPQAGAQGNVSGPRVADRLAQRLVADIIHESNGTELSVFAGEIVESQKELATMEGVLAVPEGAATLAALKHWLAQGWLGKEERVVLFNIGSGLKYL